MKKIFATLALNNMMLTKERPDEATSIYITSDLRARKIGVKKKVKKNNSAVLTS